jgi:hypothetical protein
VSLLPFSLDTDPDVHAQVLARLRAMTPTEKAHIVTTLTQLCDALATAGIKQRHPGASDDEIRMRLGVLRVGPELMLAAFGWDVREHGY